MGRAEAAAGTTASAASSEPAPRNVPCVERPERFGQQRLGRGRRSRGRHGRDRARRWRHFAPLRLEAGGGPFNALGVVPEHWHERFEEQSRVSLDVGFMNELETRQILGIEDMGVRIDDRLLAIDLDDGPGWRSPPPQAASADAPSVEAAPPRKLRLSMIAR